jgi:riboflavin kinase/FMN adenylyltransferase
VQTLIHPERFRHLPGPIVLAAGFFDGVHVGHRRVLGGAVRRARRLGGKAWALTFDQHPLAVLAPDRRPPLLTPLEVRLERLAAAGLDGCLLLPFTRELAGLAPEEFVGLLCGTARSLVEIRCGRDWRFGAHAAGDVPLLRRLGRERGFAVRIVPAAVHRGLPVSSTRIRETIQRGQLAEAAAMLGRFYSIRETVVRGRGIGRTLGMATANVHPAAEVLPPLGVYVVRTWIGSRAVDGVANLGFRPTFPDARPETPLLEVHLLDFGGDLYGATLDVAFLRRLRAERRFAGAAALMVQVRRDIAAARRALADFARPR